MLDMPTLAEEIAAIVSDEVERATQPLIARIAELEARPVAEKGDKGDPGEKGLDGSHGKDGEPGLPGADGAHGKDGIDGKDGLPGEKGLDGKDGAGIADLVIDREGSLVATFTDGRMKQLGKVVGKDGRDGVDGKSGADGKDGIPFSVDDIGMSLMEDGRTVRMAFSKGDTEYAFQIPFPVVVDRGVYSEGKEYEEGDGVTWGGSYWIAQRATTAKPDSGDSGWRLAVKRGRDGKDAK